MHYNICNIIYNYIYNDIYINMYNVDITGDDEPIGRWFKPDITSRGRQRLLNNGSGILGSSGERGLFANVGVYYTMCSYMIIYIYR